MATDTLHRRGFLQTAALAAAGAALGSLPRFAHAAATSETTIHRRAADALRLGVASY
jgi:hypothetical protein